MKCQKCHNQAILHITEVLGEEQFEELHLCEQCANKYLYESQQKAGKAAIAESGREEAGLFNGFIDYNVKWNRSAENADSLTLEARMNVGVVVVAAGMPVAIEIVCEAWPAAKFKVPEVAI